MDSPPRQSIDTNESLAWELLYNLNFRFPTELAEQKWSDAIGQTDVMQVSPFDMSSQSSRLLFT